MNVCATLFLTKSKVKPRYRVVYGWGWKFLIIPFFSISVKIVICAIISIIYVVTTPVTRWFHFVSMVTLDSCFVACISYWGACYSLNKRFIAQRTDCYGGLRLTGIHSARCSPRLLKIDVKWFRSRCCCCRAPTTAVHVCVFSAYIIGFLALAPHLAVWQPRFERLCADKTADAQSRRKPTKINCYIMPGSLCSLIICTVKRVYFDDAKAAIPRIFRVQLGLIPRLVHWFVEIFSYNEIYCCIEVKEGMKVRLGSVSLNQL